MVTRCDFASFVQGNAIVSAPFCNDDRLRMRVRCATSGDFQVVMKLFHSVDRKHGDRRQLFLVIAENLPAESDQPLVNLHVDSSQRLAGSLQHRLLDFPPEFID